MITVDEALSRVLALAAPLEAEEIALTDALDRVLAEPVRARLTQPPFNAAAMDGYALRRADLDQPLRVIGEAAAGRPWQGTPDAGTAIRIFTGAPVPEGYDHVAMQEDVSRDGDTIRVAAPQNRDNIRPQGSDFHVGSEIFPRRPLTPRDLGTIAAMNVARVKVHRRPRVAVLAGGDELVTPGTEPGPGQIICSNDIAVAAIARRAGAEATCLPIARDTLDSLRARFADAASADLIVTIGGASVGDHDLIGAATAELGMERAFYKVAMRPGKPLIAGKIGGKAMIGLPGNPVSSFVCAELFIAPLLRRMQGLPDESREEYGILGHDIGPEGDRQHYLRAQLSHEDGQTVVTPFDNQDSARLRLLSDADALMIRPAGDSARKSGEKVRFLRLR
ncbi:gephyrin-like molybdotransferase Glp [Paracoccus sp. SCSIO 75233]|uniref:molybdopterin molybdotransferase MoeA n=1 Tax=Paracoccus sp. SCSIO 75233 TaxID=3017782 RepID=UPI0022F0AC64|nr:gephyrin-like molybdotransferase Glp [Paracoccus sp. SCSIO 75233]WBU54244.1 molybdopterin molybdotransferase MoeA [Paracoccus sp. SCSIO 75233]